MQKYLNNVANTRGDAIAGALVTVTTLAGAAATLFIDNGITVRVTPLTTDANGYFEFYAADGRYTLTITKTGITPITVTDILLEDPADGSAALAASSGAALVGFIQSGTGAVPRTVQDKERDVFSVKDYAGADPTGVADSTAAFSAAAKAAPAGNAETLQYASIPMCDWAVVKVPGGTWLLSSMVDTGNREIVWLADVGAVIVNPGNLNGRLLRSGSKINDFHHGTHDSAVSFSVMANRNNDEVSPISGFTNPNQLAKGNGTDTVGFYAGNKLPPATYATAVVTSYSATGAVLATPLTTSQLAQMRKGMVVKTRHAPTIYAAYVASWTATSITVQDGWFLVDGSAAGTPVTPTGTDGLDVNVFRKAWAMNANVFIDSTSYGSQVNAFELGLSNLKGEPASRGGAVAEANGMFSNNIGGAAGYYGDAAFLVGGNWTYGYKAYGSVTHAFYYDGQTGAGGDSLQSLMYAKNSAGVPFYQIKPDGSIEAGLRGSGTATPAYIDFHSGAADADYDTRVIATNGTGATGGGTLEIATATLKLTPATALTVTTPSATITAPLATVSSSSSITLSTPTINLSSSASIEVSGAFRPAVDIVGGLGQAARRFSSVYGLNFKPGAGTVTWTSGAGTPEGAVTAAVGSMYTRTDGGANTTLYIKESGAAATGWIAK